MGDNGPLPKRTKCAAQETPETSTVTSETNDYAKRKVPKSQPQKTFTDLDVECVSKVMQHMSVNGLYFMSELRGQKEVARKVFASKFQAVSLTSLAGDSAGGKFSIVDVDRMLRTFGDLIGSLTIDFDQIDHHENVCKLLTMVSKHCLDTIGELVFINHPNSPETRQFIHEDAGKFVLRFAGEEGVPKLDPNAILLSRNSTNGKLPQSHQTEATSVPISSDPDNFEWEKAKSLRDYDRLKRLYHIFLVRTECANVGQIWKQAKFEMAQWKVKSTPNKYTDRGGVYSVLSADDYVQLGLIGQLDVSDDFMRILKGLQLILCCKYHGKDVMVKLGARPRQHVTDPSNSPFGVHLAKRLVDGEDDVFIGYVPPEHRSVYDVFEYIMINSHKICAKRYLNIQDGEDPAASIEDFNTDNFFAIALLMSTIATTEPVSTHSSQDILAKYGSLNAVKLYLKHQEERRNLKRCNANPISDSTCDFSDSN